MRYVSLMLLVFLTPFMALAGYVATAVILGLMGVAWFDNAESFRPDLTGAPRQVIGGLICFVGAILCGMAPWFTRLNPWKRMDPRPVQESRAMRYINLVLLAFLTPFLAFVGFLMAIVILCIPAMAFTNNYEYFAPALTGAPRHLIGLVGCLVGAILGGISPWFTILNPRKKMKRRPGA